MRPRHAVIAALAGILLLGSAALQSAGAQPKVSELTVQLIATNKRATLEIVGAVLNGLGLLGLAATLAFLFGASRARKPAMSQGTLITAIAGGVLAAIGSIAYAIVLVSKAHEFVSHGAQTYQQANALISTGVVAVLQYGGLLGSLLLAISFVLIALNALRVGLLTRFLGYLGIVSAAASLLLIGSAPALIVEIFWLLAVAYLLSGRWPNGEPPAWRTGQAEPWPSGAQIREQRQQAAAARGVRANGRGQRAPEPQPAAVGAATPSTRATTPKRKRKRRK